MEAAAVARSGAPVTRASLGADLVRLGVRRGAVLMVHSSMSALGWVCGGAQAVVQALLDVVGEEGTLVVPTHTNNNSDPAEWENPPVPEAWWPVVREHLPAFDVARSPSVLGAVPELVRSWPGARRSGHPQYSFAAVGAAAERVCAGHRLESGLGEGSPLARVHELDGDVLLLGVDHASNTSLHLAEYRVPEPPRARAAAAVAANGARRWTSWVDVRTDSGDFAALGAAFDATGATRGGPAGAGRATLMRQRAAVAFAVGWLCAHRPAAPPTSRV
jgi:aminoglycoside 3-N-acetyltransferase